MVAKGWDASQAVMRNSATPGGTWPNARPNEKHATTPAPGLSTFANAGADSNTSVTNNMGGGAQLGAQLRGWRM